MAIEIDPDLLAQLRQLSKAERRKVGAAMESVRTNWGRPHRHTGAGIRRLGADLHECRVGLQSRLLFQTIGTSLYVDSFAPLMSPCGSRCCGIFPERPCAPVIISWEATMKCKNSSAHTPDPSHSNYDL